MTPADVMHILRREDDAYVLVDKEEGCLMRSYGSQPIRHFLTKPCVKKLKTELTEYQPGRWRLR